MEYNASLTKWLRLSVFTHGSWFKSSIEGDSQSTLESWRGSFNLRLIFQPLPTMDVAIDGGAELPQESLESRQNASYALSLDLSKSFFKDKLYLSLHLNGIVFTKRRYETWRSDGSYYSVLREPKGPRDLALSFTLSYRFSHNAKKNVKTVQSIQQQTEIVK